MSRAGFFFIWYPARLLFVSTISAATIVFKTSWNSGSKISEKNTFSQLLIQQTILCYFINELAKINNMANIPFSSSMFLTVFYLLVLLWLWNDKFQKDVVVIQEELLKRWTVLFGLSQDSFKNFENFIVQNVIVFEGFHELDQ